MSFTDGSGRGYLYIHSLTFSADLYLCAVWVSVCVIVWQGKYDKRGKNERGDR